VANSDQIPQWLATSITIPIQGEPFESKIFKVRGWPHHGSFKLFRGGSVDGSEEILCQLLNYLSKGDHVE